MSTLLHRQKIHRQRKGGDDRDGGGGGGGGGERGGGNLGLVHQVAFRQPHERK
ncbi:hypothetical protein E2C01_072138 [Portunus trituberculatus]|uniref:Uncharacterized protein n=1 Tax=Portunus trituberculatus TaxID=210409 RepID=A0A5B7HZ52_PORTR|nr:hypothetical protein [Portunus trituberculatus]